MVARYTKIEGWPESPQSLKSGKSRPWQISVNVLYISLTCLFFVYAGLVAHSDQSPKTDLVPKLHTASRYGPTVFPVLYTFIVGSAIRSFALWRLQEGAKIGFLDLILGSTSLGNAVATQFERQFMHLIVLSTCILGIWLFSPLGGQATLRIREYKDIPIVLQQEIGYLDLSRASFPLGMKMGDYGAVFDNINTAFLASLASPQAIKDGQQDTWANIKVPMIEGMPGYISSGDNSSEWISLPDHIPDAQYSSLIGIPTANIPDTGITSFTMETSYWTIHCPELMYPKDYDDEYWVNKTTLPTFSGTSQSPVSNLAVNDGSSAQGVRSVWGWILSVTSNDNLKKRCESKPGEDVPLRRIFYRSENVGGDSDPNPTAVNCSLATTYVEVSVQCTGWECKLDRIRKSQNSVNRRANAWTTLDPCPEDDFEQMSSQFLSHLVEAADYQRHRSGMPGVLQNYIQSPAAPFTTDNYEMDLTNVGNTTFSLRLAQLLNSYWAAVYGYSITFEGRPKKFPNITSYGFYAHDPFTYVDGEYTRADTRFVYNRGWMAILIISTSIMFAAGIAKLLLDLNIWIPDLLMNVSTLLRGNGYNCPSLPYGGSTLEDSERSRHLRDRMVRFGNILTEDGHAGELGIGEAVEAEGMVTKVKGDMKYW
ncbi:hypothetical protein F4815DRAFT_470312 [Daldinia loculata]|nr:hypothetical protein F4815DRAFT_470312 [Daldinia loculata]